MNESTHIDTTVSRVEAALNYLAETAEKPVTFMYKTEHGAPQRTYQNVKHTMAILNGRAVNERLTLDHQGFALVHDPTAIADFYDEAEVRAVYYPEVERLVKQATGAVRVLVFDHNVRCGPMAKEGLNGAREPVRFAHNDYTLKSGPQRVRDLMGDEAEALLKNRFVVHQRMAADSRAGGRSAACGMRRAEHAPCRLHPDRPQVPRPHRRGLLAGFQPGASMVLFSADGARRGAAAQVLRLVRSTGAHDGPRIRRSTIRHRRPTPPAREYRSPHDGVLRAREEKLNRRPG